MKEIGGFLDVEFRGNSALHASAAAVNSCRNALRLFVRCRQIKRTYIPFFTCDAVYKALKEEGVLIDFYHIDRNLLPVDVKTDLDKDELLIYTDYWGICGKNIEIVVEKYSSQLLIDAAQAFYYVPSENVPVINSCRKFFGVPDGGYLYADISDTSLQQDRSNERFGHLLKRYECGGGESYKKYVEAEQVIDSLEVMKMSELTEGLLSVIDYTACAERRLSNFQILHDALKDRNQLCIEKISLSSDIPMVYPFWTEDCNLRKRLIENKIYVATYWPNVLEWCSEQDIEYKLAKEIIPLPIDQRYGREEMEWIIKNIEISC